MQTQIHADHEGFSLGAELLRAGQLVAFPTETVYGLGADARSDAAVRKIYEAKGRPSGNPLIVHVGSVDAARTCAAAGEWNQQAEALARQFWPGPLTIIVRRGAGISALVSAGRDTVALRMPRHSGAVALLAAFRGPIAAPSANRSGFTSPTTARHVLAELEGRVPLILDGGACAVGIESTVVDISSPGRARILRPGAVTSEMLREVIGEVEVVGAVIDEAESAASPGQHLRHYAPRTPAVRFEIGQWERVRAVIASPVALITWSEGIYLGAPHETIRLPEDAVGYARNLYRALREADDKAVMRILVLMPADETGLWAAVADRLRRATVEER